MENYFDRLNKETRDYNNGVSRNIGWYDVTGIYNNKKYESSRMKSKGHYDGRGVWVND